MYSIPQRLGIEPVEIEGALWQWACRMRNAIPAIVKSFNPDEQTCTVQIAIREYAMLPSSSSNSYIAAETQPNIPTSRPIPPLEDVPIIMMRVPGWSITLPIT